MRDGVRIAIDVWLPDDLESRDKVPAIMRSTRYWRARDIVGAAIEQDSNFQMATTLNEAGYAYVCVDARGTGASFGPGRMR
jgi:predicted acyl esterase